MSVEKLEIHDSKSNANVEDGAIHVKLASGTSFPPSSLPEPYLDDELNFFFFDDLCQVFVGE